MDLSQIGPILVGILGSLGGLAAWRKARGEKANLHVQTADEVVELVRGEMQELKQRVDAERAARLEMELRYEGRLSSQREEINLLRDEVEVLRTRLQEANNRLNKAKREQSN